LNANCLVPGAWCTGALVDRSNFKKSKIHAQVKQECGLPNMSKELVARALRVCSKRSISACHHGKRNCTFKAEKTHQTAR
jgi:hypothetical protein